MTRPASLSPRAERGLVVAAYVAIAAWAILSWTVLRPSSIAIDWQGIRQTDTQAIARHFVEPGANLFYPRVDWGGDGTGYVEAELQLYSGLVSLMLRVFGDVEWPGQLISLLASSASACVLFRGLLSRLGALPAVCGLGIFLASPIVLFTATSVQPDALALLGYVVAWFAFLRYRDEGDWKSLVTYGIAGGLAMLIKPTMAQLGISSFVLLLVVSPKKLKDPLLWVTWFSMVFFLVLHMRHALHIYEVSGNSFGVLSGNDAKTPKLEHLLMPKLYFRALRLSYQFGTGFLGAVALLAAIARPRDHAQTFALLIGNACWIVFTLRYSSDFGGTHYLLCLAILTAQAGAQAVTNWHVPARRSAAVLAVLVILIAVFVGSASRFRVRQPKEDQSAPAAAAAARELAKRAHAGELIVVRARVERYDSFWRTQNNVNDPRVFYLTKTRGWGIASDEVDPSVLESYRARRARFYVRPFAGSESAGVDAWLRQHAELFATTEFGGKVYALDPA